MGSIGDEARQKWEENPDMIPEGSEVFKKVEMVKQENKTTGLTDGQKLAKFIIAAMVMHSGIVAFAP
jgi:Neuraminidase (sialidase)